MRAYSCKGLNNREVLEKLSSKLAQNRGNTAEILALIAEAESRRLYLPAGYPSMYQYCVYELHMSEQTALKHLRAARLTRRFPAIFDAIAEGQLHLTAVFLLKPHLTRANAGELLAAVTHKTRAQIERILAERFPQADVPTRLEPIAEAPPRASEAEALTVGGPVSGQLSPGTVGTPIQSVDSDGRSALGHAEANGSAEVEGAVPAPAQLSPGTVGTTYPRLKPLSAERFALQVTISKSAHDKLRRAQDLLGHRIPSGDIEQVLECALDLLIKDLEKQKFAATDRPQTKSRPATNKRTIPAHVKRAVNERDQGQCTFVGTSGRQCPARSRLEFDHLEPVARGGESTMENLRLRCRAHNQYEAEQVFGDGFMHQKRESARSVAQAWHAVQLNPRGA